ncbi:MAG TPA: YfhO family protein [Caldilineae bacterium]|nr:YfhO family protein [Caldilineae bacterium]
MFITLSIIYLALLAFIAWRRRAWLPDALVPGLLALLTAGFFWRVVSGQNYMPADGGDLGSFLYPTYSFIQTSLKAGVWPLWNPHIYSGVPFAAEVQSGILYPPHLLRFLLGPALVYRDMELLAMAHIWWAGVTTYALVRGLGLRRGPALFAAVAFMFSDVFIIHFGNLNLIAVISWLPLALLGVHRALLGGGIRWALGAGLALGIGSLVGHVQMTLYGLMAIGLWVVLWAVLTRDDIHWRRLVTAVLVPVAITLGLLAPVLLPGLQMAGLTDRADWNYVQTVGFSLSPAQLIGLLVPGFFGRGPAFHWGLWPRVEVGYIGVITLLLALLGVFMKRDRLTWLLVGLAAISLAFSLGIYSIVHGWFTWLLPGLEQLRAPARFIFLFDLALAILAARGLQALIEPWTEASRIAFDSVWRFLRTILLIALAVGIPVIYAILLLTQMGDPALFLRTSISTIAIVGFILLLAIGMALLYARRREWVSPGVFVVLAIALLFIDLASLGAYQDLSDTDPTANFNRQTIIDFLRSDPEPHRIDTSTGIDDLWQPDTALLQGLEDTSGVANPLTLSYYLDFMRSTGSRSSDLYALLNVKYLLGRKDVVLEWDAWELAFAGDPDLNVYLNRRFQPRALLLGRAISVPDLAAAQDVVRQPDFRPLTAVVLEGGEAQEYDAGRVTRANWGVNDAVVSTESAEPGALLVSQVWYPGWEASIDGGPWRPALRADGVWQAVQLSAGSHQVRLRFRSPSFLLGLAIALLTLIVVAVVWGVSYRKRDATTSS